MTPREKYQNDHSAQMSSELASDPEMAELVEYFLNELRLRVDRMAAAWKKSSNDELRGMVQQLKGAAGGFGYPSISKSASDLEAALLAEESEVQALTEKFESLIALCRRATSTTSGAGPILKSNPSPRSK
jgi:HPt (histidine-containing phosphotransfer) domain-containing protein